MRPNIFALALLAGCAATSSTPAGAADADVTTPAGKDVRLGAYAVFRPDCSGGVAAEVRPAGNQRGGVLVISPGTLATTRVPNCGKVEAPARIVIYRPNPGFTGREQVTFDVVDGASGRRQTHVVSVDVTP